MATDLEIARSTPLKPIAEIGQRLGISPEFLEPFGHFKAKISLDAVNLKEKPKGKLILVTAISPTPPGEGKTTTTIGLGDGLRRLGKRVAICLREPSLGPVFGMKGGATGGGRAQVAPMEEINLHFTGDFSAIGLANNLLAALLDNHIHHGNTLDIDPRRVAWRRVVDMNDRALRSLVVGLGGTANGFPREDGFDIVVASEVMAILCLATSYQDLKERLGKIVVGYSRAGAPIRAQDLKAHGAMAALLKDAMKPNLVQTLEGTPAIIHGGPFANIAHGCNSVIATKLGLQLSDYVVTEAGFGADLGAEKFLDIKCRKSGLKPSVAVIVATLRALKYHGGVEPAALQEPNLAALEKGVANLERHLNNLRKEFNLPCVVAINHFSTDLKQELDWLIEQGKKWEVPIVTARHWAEGGAGAEELARTVVQRAEQNTGTLKFLYSDEMSLWDKMHTIATRFYGASQVTAEKKVRETLQKLEALGADKYPVCVAKTQYSFSTDPTLRGAPSGHTLHIREVRLCAGAEFVVFICGEIMTMPGLPKNPAAHHISLDDRGEIQGLS